MSRSRLLGVVSLPTTVGELAAKLTEVDPDTLVVTHLSDTIEIRTPGEPCWCRECRHEEDSLRMATSGRLPMMFMIVCPDCGSKRCPRAGSHTQPCEVNVRVGDVFAERA